MKQSVQNNFLHVSNLINPSRRSGLKAAGGRTRSQMILDWAPRRCADAESVTDGAAAKNQDFGITPGSSRTISVSVSTEYEVVRVSEGVHDGS